MSTATYLYCLVHTPKAPSLAKVPAGLPGTSAPRALPAGRGLWLVAADAPLDLYGEKPIEAGLHDLAWVSARAMPHEAVVEHLSRKGTVVPMKLFTLFNSDERALEHVARDRKRIDRIVTRLAGREEWGVRLTLDEINALRRARDEAAQSAPKGATGSAFLLRKKKEQDAARELLDHARERADELFEELAKKAAEARRRPPPPGEAGKRVLLDAAFLLPRAKLKPFQALVKSRGADLAKLGYELEITGPWPPYNFVGDAA